MDNEVHRKPIYIVGRRHSGSTFLDVLLGDLQEVESLGEIVTGLHLGPDQPMGDGSLMRESQFWNKARDIMKNAHGLDIYDVGEYLYRESDVKKFFRYYFCLPKISKLWKKYESYNRVLLTVLSEAAENRRILDSNKEYTRALIHLKQFEKSQVIHLVRNPISIAGSHYYRIKVKGAPVGFLKAHFRPGPFLLPILMITVGVSWSVGMALIALIKLKYGDRIIDVSYERFCRSPEQEISRIGEFLNVDTAGLVDVVSNKTSIAVGNNIGGNELRFEGQFTFIPNAEGRRYLPYWYKAGIWICSLPGLFLEKLIIRY